MYAESNISVHQTSKHWLEEFLLALAEAGKADYLVIGDKSGLLALGRHQATRILSASDFALMFT